MGNIETMFLKNISAFAAKHQVYSHGLAIVAGGFIYALALPAIAQNLVVNGNFTNNATAFVTWPGYVGSGSDPTNVPGWTQVSGSAGGYGVNGAGTVTSVFGPASTGGNTFLFIQASSTKELAQNLPTLLTNTTYTLSFQAAARNGESGNVFMVQIGDQNGSFVTSGGIAANNTVFQYFTYIFTTPASFNGVPCIQLYNLNPATGHSVDFTAVSVQAGLGTNDAPPALAVFVPLSGDWNVPSYWNGGVVPGTSQSPDILNGSVITVDSSVGTCASLYVGQGNQTPSGTVLFRPGATLTAANIFLGRDGTNFGQFNQSGGVLTVNGVVSVGDATGGGTGASGNYNFSGGTVKLSNPNGTVMVGNQGLGQMLMAGQAVLSTPAVVVGAAAGAAGSQLFQWGGTIYASNLTIGATGVSNCSFTISSGVTSWTGTLLVNGDLKAQGSQFLLQDTAVGGVGLQVGGAGKLRLEMDAQGFSPIRIPNAQFGIAPGSQLAVDGSCYMRWLAQPGTFPLILHAGYADQAQFAATNVTLTGFGDLTASLSYQSNALNLVLSAPAGGAARVGGGLLCEYWEVPITVNPGVAGRTLAAPLSALPSFTNSLVVTHPIFGRVVTNIDLTQRRRDTNYFMRFSGSLSVPTNGSYTLYLNSADGSRLWLDGNLVVNNDGVHAPAEVSTVTNLSAGMHALVIGYFQTADAQVLNASWAGPGFAKQPIPSSALSLSGLTNLSVRQPVYQNIVQDSTAVYNYAPSFMYDEVEGLYKIWMCGAGIPGCVGGDNILYREATSLQGLMTAPLTVALQPSLDPTKFDQIHACDPNVYRVGNLMYMAYGGNTDGSQLVATTRLGMAISYDGGRTFQRLNNGNAILSPNPADAAVYGIGQPAVVPAPNGYFYMIYTDVSTNNGTYVRIIRSLDPAFTPGNFTNVVSISSGTIGGFSLDLAFDDNLSQFVIINESKLEYYTTNWTYVQTLTLTNPFSWTLGEGYGLLMNSQKRPVNYNQDGIASYVLSGSTVDSTNDTSLWANWVAGDLKYLVVPLNAAPAIAALPGTNFTAGISLKLPVHATDPNLPPLRLSYSLLSAPAGMTINPVSGAISWRPVISQSATTNMIVVRVTDYGMPPLVTTQSFMVTVMPPPAPSLVSPALGLNTFSVLVNGVAGPDYILQITTNVTRPAGWLPIITNAAASPPFTFTDPNLHNYNQKLYRVQLGP